MLETNDFEIPFFDSFLSNEELTFLKQYSEEVKSYATDFHKEQSLIIGGTEEWNQDYPEPYEKLNPIFKKLVSTIKEAKPSANMTSVEHWFIFSNLDHKEPISVTHGAHFDDNKWTTKKDATIAPPTLIAIFYLYDTPTSLRVFNADYKDRKIIERVPESLLKFRDIECRGNRLIILPGEKFHGVVGTLKDSQVVKRTGLVFNLWEESPQRPWWL